MNVPIEDYDILTSMSAKASQLRWRRNERRGFSEWTAILYWSIGQPRKKVKRTSFYTEGLLSECWKMLGNCGLRMYILWSIAVTSDRSFSHFFHRWFPEQKNAQFVTPRDACNGKFSLTERFLLLASHHVYELCNRRQNIYSGLFAVQKVSGRVI